MPSTPPDGRPSTTAARAQSRPPHSRHPHDDAPDTSADFRRLATLPAGPERDDLRCRVVCAWLPMSERLALHFRNRGESGEDLRQVAALGLVKAVDRYDPDRGCAFESFAVPTIVGEVKRHFRDHMWGLHVPRRVQELRNRVRTARHELARGADDHGPSPEEIAAHTGMTKEEVLLGTQALESYTTLSLDAELPGADDGYSLADTLGAAEPGFDLVLDREAVKPKLRELPERERQILYLRFFRDMTQSRIADLLGISQMHVSRIISRTCRRLGEEAGTVPAGRDGETGGTRTADGVRTTGAARTTGAVRAPVVGRTRTVRAAGAGRTTRASGTGGPSRTARAARRTAQRQPGYGGRPRSSPA